VVIDPLAWEAIEPVEVLHFQCKTHRASIRLAKDDDAWIWAVDFQRYFGDHLGHLEPLGLRGGHVDPARVSPTRQAALEAAAARIARHMPDRPLADWLASLTPAQADLFGEPA